MPSKALPMAHLSLEEKKTLFLHATITHPQLEVVHAEAAPPKRRRMSQAGTESIDVPGRREGAQAALYRHRVCDLFEGLAAARGFGGTR